LLLGLRAGEIVALAARSIDDGGRLVWIMRGKTKKARRRIKVPEVLQPFLIGLKARRQPLESLFGHHWRDWPRENVQRICGLAGVPKVTAQGMRGLHGTLAEEEAGATGQAVATTLGHESVKTTHRHYTSQDAQESARQDRALKVLMGGKS
jgi:integrase